MNGGLLRLPPASRVSLIAVIWLVVYANPASALPEFARRFGVACVTCHSIPPRLNQFGQAFQANHFNWPGEAKMTSRKGLLGLPVSAIASASYSNNFTKDTHDTDFRNLNLFASDGFRVGRFGQGGYFVNAVTATNQSGEQSGNLLDAFAALPVAGPGGQLALVAGQFSPMLYQYDPVNSLTSAQPSALGMLVDGFTFLSPMPGVRLEWFDNRQKGTADGNYVAFGAPFGGSLALNHTSRWDGGHGLTAHAFHRNGSTSLGVFGYTRAGNHLEGAMATHEVAKDLHLLGVGSLGHDSNGSVRDLSVQAEFTPTSAFAFTGRLEFTREPAGAGSSGGGGGYRSSRAPGDSSSDFGFVGAVTYYPLKIQVLRLTGELVERKGNRTFTLFTRGQF